MNRKDLRLGVPDTECRKCAFYSFPPGLDCRVQHAFDFASHPMNASMGINRILPQYTPVKVCASTLKAAFAEAFRIKNGSWATEPGRGGRPTNYG